MFCIYCATDEHHFCSDPLQQLECCCNAEETNEEEIPRVHGNPLSKEELIKTFKDDLSTGRKRAAKDAPITDGMGCEWTGLKNAGGGVVPIVGCRPEEQLLAVARHHGPDKATFNNALGTNLHRICVRCHNRWHTRNDEFYGVRPSQGMPFLPKEPIQCIPHDPDTLASHEDFAASITYWSQHREFKAKPETEDESV